MQWLPLSWRTAQTSLGTTRFFLSIYLPHLSLVIPCSYWASACYAVLPSRKTLYVISFRQTRDLPVVSLFPHPASFRFPSRGHPCLRLYPSHCRVDSGLAPIRNVRRQAHIKNSRTECTACTAVLKSGSHFQYGSGLTTSMPINRSWCPARKKIEEKSSDIRATRATNGFPAASAVRSPIRLERGVHPAKICSQRQAHSFAVWSVPFLSL